jgi:ion channel
MSYGRSRVKVWPSSVVAVIGLWPPSSSVDRVDVTARTLARGTRFAGTAPEGTDAGTKGAALAKWVYSSFITLTTVGYGDITPVAPAVRSLMILEALHRAVLRGRAGRAPDRALLQTRLAGDWGARTRGGPPCHTRAMKKRRPLTKLIGDLATRTGGSTPRSGWPSGSPVAARRISPRKPPARAEASERLVTVPSGALQGSPILAALAKTAQTEARRRRPTRDKSTSRRPARTPTVQTSRHAKRGRRAS